MTKEEEKLLVYLETCLVDGLGYCDPRRINEDDLEVIDRWTKSGFIGFRFVPPELRKGTGTHRVTFCDDAWSAAANARRRRAERHTETYCRHVLVQLYSPLQPFPVGIKALF